VGEKIQVKLQGISCFLVRGLSFQSGTTAVLPEVLKLNCFLSKYESEAHTQEDFR